MKNIKRQNGAPLHTRLLAPVMVVFAALLAGGCESPADSEGTLFNEILLPTDTLLNLACADVGIGAETCVLEDPENPFVNTPIIEFDVNNPGAENKFELFNSLPPGPRCS